MTLRLPLAVCAVLLALCSLSGLSGVRAEEASAEARAAKTAADLLPPSTISYVEFPQARSIVRGLLDHPLRKDLEQAPDYQKVFQTEQYRQFLIAVEAFEDTIKMKWPDALETLLDGGLYLAVDGETEGFVVLGRAKDEKALARIRDVGLNIIRDIAVAAGQGNPLEAREYRGLSGFRIGKNGGGVLATMDRWFVISNKPPLVKEVADNYLDAGRPSLAQSAGYKQARGATPGERKPFAWAFADLAEMRKRGLDKREIPDRSDNPVAEVLAGGLLSSIKKAEFVTAAIERDPRDNAADLWRVSVAIPHDQAAVPEARKFFFRPEGTPAYSPLAPKGEVLSVATYRDLGAMWMAKEDLFPENVIAQMAKADGDLTTIFGGHRFGQDILGALRPELQFVVTRQEYADAKIPKPTIKLPAFALVTRLKDPAKVQRQLKVSYQSLIGFLNVIGGQAGQPQLEMTEEKVGDGRMVAATYDPSDDANQKARNDIVYNFSPAIAFTGDYFILSSTGPLAQELMGLAGKPGPAGREPPLVENIRTQVDLTVGQQILADNRPHLVAQNMLEKGHDRETAEREVDLLLRLAKAVKGIATRLSIDKSTARFDLEVKLAK